MGKSFEYQVKTGSGGKVYNFNTYQFTILRLNSTQFLHLTVYNLQQANDKNTELCVKFWSGLWIQILNWFLIRAQSAGKKS